MPKPNVHDGGIGRVVEPALNTVVYSDATYQYVCEAAPGTGSARSATEWRVCRKTLATGDLVYAGTGAFEHAATDLATVAALTYILGA